MKIGFIGDIVGKPGRLMIAKHLCELKAQYELDFVIANGENASHGFGITKKNADELLGYGVDFLTGGNHSFDKKEILEYMDSLPIIRPLNYPDASAGVGYKIVQIGEKKLAIVNLMGHFAMAMCDNPFTKILDCIDTIKAQSDYILIDFHAEATAEKQALFYMLKDKVDAIIGTHTHVATDDLIIDEGSVYVSDVGLTGCRDCVLGMQSHIAIERFLTGYSKHFDIPKECKSILQMVVIEFGDGAKDAVKLKQYDNGDLIESRAYRK